MKKIFILYLSVLFTSPLFSSGIDMGATGVACDETTLETYGGTTDMEIEWEPNTINLNWWNGDEQVAGQATCTYDGIINVPTQPVRPGYTFNGWKVTKVPGGYTELQYIEATGTQWIDTGLTLDTNLTIVKQYVGFGYSQLPTKRELTGGPGIDNINYFGVQPLNNKVVFEIYKKGTYAITANTMYDVYFEIKNRISLLEAYQNSSRVEQIQQKLGSSSPDNFDGSSTLIFNIPRKGNDYAMMHARISYYKIYFDNNMVRNLIPAKRNSDNVVGMYDSISDTFFTNAGTGSFIAGPAVQ